MDIVCCGTWKTCLQTSKLWRQLQGRVCVAFYFATRRWNRVIPILKMVQMFLQLHTPDTWWCAHNRHNNRIFRMMCSLCADFCACCVHHHVPGVCTCMDEHVTLQIGSRRFQRRVPISNPTQTRRCSCLQSLHCKRLVSCLYAVYINRHFFEKIQFRVHR